MVEIAIVPSPPISPGRFTYAPPFVVDRRPGNLLLLKKETV